MPTPDPEVKKEVDSENESTVQSFPVPLMVYAQVTRLATDDDIKKEEKSSSLNENKSDTIKRVEEVLKVVKKEETGEDEAKYALQLSAKVLSSANSKESREILHESSKKEDQIGGHSAVTIRRKDGGGIKIRKWTSDIVNAICEAFNVKGFYRNRQHVIFYGLRDNTVAAAMSFEAIFNLTLTWAANRQNKNCYLLGLSSSIYEMTKAEQKAEEEQAVMNEKRLQNFTIPVKKKKLNVQAVLSNTKATSVMDEDYDGIAKCVEPSRSLLKSVNVEVKLEKDEDALINKKRPNTDDEEIQFVGWPNLAQLMKFRKMAKCVAKEYFKENFKPFSHTLVLEKVNVQDDLAFQIGQNDARHVNLKCPRFESA